MDNQLLYNDLNSLNNIIDNNSRILFIHGNSSYNNSIAKKYFDSVEQIAFEITVKASNPKINILESDYNKIKDIKYNIIVAIGGGSVIDTAKFMLYTSLYNKIYERSSIKFIAIPTTAGSGSEATPFAVYYDKQNTKCSLDIPELLPDIVILKPDLLINLSKYQKACGLADAFCQALESFWAIKSNDTSKKYALKSLSIINEIVFDYIDNNKQLDKALESSYLAGKSIAITRTTISHALSYPITSHWNIPHGHAVSLTIAECLLMNEKHISDSDKKCLFSIFKVNSAEELKNYLEDMFNKIGLERKLSNLGINKKDIDVIIKEINLNRLSNNPVQPSYDELYNLLLRIL